MVESKSPSVSPPIQISPNDRSSPLSGKFFVLRRRMLLNAVLLACHRLRFRLKVNPDGLRSLSMARSINTKTDLRTFKTVFCEHFGCSEDSFEKKLFQNCLPLAWRPFASTLCRIAPDFFSGDLQYVEEAGEATDKRELISLANHIRNNRSFTHGLLRKKLRLRISGRRLLNIQREIAPKWMAHYGQSQLQVRPQMP